MEVLNMLSMSGAHNSIAFGDVDADGDCDVLAAREVPNPDQFPNPNNFESYVIFNDRGQRRPVGSPIFFLPNPAFGKHHAGFDAELADVGSERLVFLTAAKLTSWHGGWDKFQMQVFRFDGQAFAEVTGQRLDRQLPIKYAGQRKIRFADIDRDGDLDLYMSQYSDEIAIYRNVEGKFTRERIKKADGAGPKGVAFLANTTRPCADMVVIGLDAVLRRYKCQ